MVKAPGIKVPPHDAEGVRRRLLEAGLLRDDLIVYGDASGVVFPVHDSLPDLEAVTHDFRERAVRPRDYTELLPESMRGDAPRAFDRLGDIVLVKIPKTLWEDRYDIGAALLEFHRGVRAIFHDHGVTGEFRVRELELISGDGDAETEVNENGVRLTIDPSKAYYSPRLASERARISGLVDADETILDMFGGVGPQSVQLAKGGAIVTCIDLNPDATRLATRNAAQNGVEMTVKNMDARNIEGRFDRVIMNLPHGAKHFLDVARRVAGQWIHYHEILQRDDVQARCAELAQELHVRGARVVGTRHVRDYSKDEAHFAFDIKLENP